jgi:hypothetical protein
MAAGSKEDPWVLTTPPGTSGYTMYKDEQADPPVLVCQVGSTTLKYRLQAIDDLQAWLGAQDDWVPLGAADEKKPAAPGTVEAWGRSADNPVGAGTGCATVIAAGSGCISRRCSKRSAWPRSPTIHATTGCERSERQRFPGRRPAWPHGTPQAATKHAARKHAAALQLGRTARRHAARPASTPPRSTPPRSTPCNHAAPQHAATQHAGTRQAGHARPAHRRPGTAGRPRSR